MKNILHYIYIYIYSDIFLFKIEYKNYHFFFNYLSLVLCVEFISIKNFFKYYCTWCGKLKNKLIIHITILYLLNEL